MWLPAFIETSMIHDYNLTSAEYAYIISVCYLGAAVGCFIASFGIVSSNHNHTTTLYKFLALLFCSHLVTFFCLYFYEAIYKVYMKYNVYISCI